MTLDICFDCPADPARLVVALGWSSTSASRARCRSGAIRRRRSPGWSRWRCCRTSRCRSTSCSAAASSACATRRRCLPPIDGRAPTADDDLAAGRAASAARWAWRRPRALRASCASTPTAPRRCAALLELIARRDAHARRLHLHPRPRSRSAARSPRRCAARARAGVKVRLLIDGIGAWLGGRLDVGALRRSGVEVVKFVPPFRSILRGRANLRNHRKMLVADGERLWCGGRNFAAEYFEGDRATGGERRAWHDLSFDLRGAARRQAARALRPRLGLCDARCRAPRACPRDRQVGAAGRRAARAAGAERPRAGRRHRAGAARLGLLHGARAASSRSRRTSFPTRPC